MATLSQFSNQTGPMLWYHTTRCGIIQLLSYNGTMKGTVLAAFAAVLRLSAFTVSFLSCDTHHATGELTSQKLSFSL